jgi:hypothetical protein
VTLQRFLEAVDHGGWYVILVEVDRLGRIGSNHLLGRLPDDEHVSPAPKVGAATLAQVVLPVSDMIVKVWYRSEVSVAPTRWATEREWRRTGSVVSSGANKHVTLDGAV